MPSTSLAATMVKKPKTAPGLVRSSQIARGKPSARASVSAASHG